MDQTNDQPQTPAQPAEQQQTTEQAAPAAQAVDVDLVLAKLKAAEEKAAQYEAKMKEREVAELTAKQEWQKLAQMEAEEKKKAQQELDQLKAGIVKYEKVSALSAAALAAGLHKEAVQELSRLDFPEVKLETGVDGKKSIKGVEKAIQRLKTERPYLFKSATVNVNPNSPSTTTAGSTTFEAIRKLEIEYKKNPTKENANAYREALLSFKKTGA